MVSRSTAEVELRLLAVTIYEIFIRTELGMEFEKPMMLKCDN